MRSPSPGSHGEPDGIGLVGREGERGGSRPGFIHPATAEQQHLVEGGDGELDNLGTEAQVGQQLPWIRRSSYSGDLSTHLFREPS